MTRTVMVRPAVRNQKIILTKSFSNTYKPKKWQMLLNHHYFLKNLWKKREQKTPSRVSDKLFYHLEFVCSSCHGCLYLVFFLPALYLMVRRWLLLLFMPDTNLFDVRHNLRLGCLICRRHWQLLAGYQSLNHWLLYVWRLGCACLYGPCLKNWLLDDCV